MFIIVEQGEKMYNYQSDDNLDPHEAVMSLRTYDKPRLLVLIDHAVAAGWQLEHYEGRLGAVFIR